MFEDRCGVQVLVKAKENKVVGVPVKVVREKGQKFSGVLVNEENGCDECALGVVVRMSGVEECLLVSGEDGCG